MRTILLAVLAVVLAGVVGVVLRPKARDDGTLSASAVRPAAVAPGVSGPVPAAVRQGWVATILARPLFAPGRRPPSAVASAPAAGLPRVAGIVVDGAGRRVIFAASSEGGRPLVVMEGGEVNGFKVQSIETGEVTVSGPDGVRVLRPSFDPKPPAPPASASGLPGLPAGGLTGIPGLPQPGAAR